jgi:hypothetical protein
VLAANSKICFVGYLEILQKYNFFCVKKFREKRVFVSKQRNWGI